MPWKKGGKRGVPGSSIKILDRLAWYHRYTCNIDRFYYITTSFPDHLYHHHTNLGIIYTCTEWHTLVIRNNKWVFNVMLMLKSHKIINLLQSFALRIKTWDKLIMYQMLYIQSGWFLVWFLVWEMWKFSFRFQF